MEGKSAQSGGPGRGRGDGRGRGGGRSRGPGAGRGSGGAAASPEAVKHPLEPHGRVWTVIESKQRETEGFMEPHKARLNWPNTFRKSVGERKPLDYFNLFHPRTSESKMFSSINLQIAKMCDLEPRTSLGEVTKVLGIRLAMAIDPVRGGRGDCWK